MASTSRLPAVKLALVDLLQTAFADSETQVSYGHPGRDVEREFVFVGDTAEWDTEWASLGAKASTERFALVLVANAVRPGDEQQEATERVFEMFGQAEDALNAELLGGVLLVPALLVGNTFDEYLTDEGRGAVISASVRCQARLHRGI